jgi:hypothetical protein
MPTLWHYSTILIDFLEYGRVNESNSTAHIVVCSHFSTILTLHQLTFLVFPQDGKLQCKIYFLSEDSWEKATNNYKGKWGKPCILTKQQAKLQGELNRVFISYSPRSQETVPTSEEVVKALIATMSTDKCTAKYGMIFKVILQTHTNNQQYLQKYSGAQASTMYIPAKYNPKYQCFHVYFPNRQLLQAAMLHGFISTKPLLRVVPSLCISQSPLLFRLFLRIDARIHIKNKDIWDWFGKGEVSVYGIGPVVDRASNTRSNMYFLLINPKAANKCLNWILKEEIALESF